MKRTIILSMAGIVCSFWGEACFADTLQDALKSGTVGGEIKYMYVNGSDTSVDAVSGIDDKISQATAIHLNYKSGDFHGFNLGLSFQNSQDMTSSDDTPEPRLAFTDTALSQIYLQYVYEKSDIKYGRQFIATPLIKNNKGWAMYDSFDGVVLTTNVIPDTKLSGIVIKDWHTSWSNTPKVHYDDPVYSLYVQNQSIAQLKLIGQYMSTSQEGNNGDSPSKTTDGYATYFSQADYKFSSDTPVTLSLQGGGASFDNANEDDTWFYGAKLAATLMDINLESAYTSVADDNDFPGTLGHAANAAMFNHMLINTSLFAGLDSLSLKAGYDFGKIGVDGLQTSLMYTAFNQSYAGMVNGNSARDMDDSYEIDIDVKYAFSGDLKGLSMRIWAGYADYDLTVPSDVNDTDGNTDDITYVRCFVDYKF